VLQFPPPVVLSAASTFGWRKPLRPIWARSDHDGRPVDVGEVQTRDAPAQHRDALKKLGRSLVLPYPSGATERANCGPAT